MRAPSLRGAVVADGHVGGVAAPCDAVSVGGPRGVDAVAAVARAGRRVRIGAAAEARVRAAAALLDRLIEHGSRIYGVITGFGPLACQQVTPAQ